MALYLGGNNGVALLSSDGYILQDSDNLHLTALSTITKQKIILNNVVYRLNVNLNSKESE